MRDQLTRLLDVKKVQARTGYHTYLSSQCLQYQDKCHVEQQEVQRRDAHSKAVTDSSLTLTKKFWILVVNASGIQSQIL